jgi:hypothetical protein
MISYAFIWYRKPVGRVIAFQSGDRFMTLQEAICIVMIYEPSHDRMSLKEREILYEARKIVRENAEQILRTELKKD